MKKLRLFLTGLVGVAAAAAAALAVENSERPATAERAPGTVGRIAVKGAIGPAVSSYIERSIGVAAERGDEVLLIELDTPGGLLETTKQIVQAFYASPVPVVVWVSPQGASAGSAGCFITLAADIAAMAPGTNIGAATPVTMGGSPATPPSPVPEEAPKASDDSEEKDEDNEKPKPSGSKRTNPVERKMENYAASFMQSIAEKRGRNVEWAVSSVTEGAAITADEALEKGVIDLIATDLTELLKAIDGREVGDKTLRTAGARVIEIPKSWGESLFQAIWRPEVLFILTLAAIYGILGEISNPGAMFPGMIGVLSLVLLLYLSASLPVNAAAFALIGLAIALLLLEVFTPTNGILSVGGVVAFVLGALLLFDRTDPAFSLPLGLVIPGALMTAVFFFFVVGAGLKAQRRPVVTGREAMRGTLARVLSAGPDGLWVLYDGERWRAATANGGGNIAPGDVVRVLSSDHLILHIEPTTQAQS